MWQKKKQNQKSKSEARKSQNLTLFSVNLFAEEIADSLMDGVLAVER